MNANTKKINEIAMLALSRIASERRYITTNNAVKEAEEMIEVARKAFDEIWKIEKHDNNLEPEDEG